MNDLGVCDVHQLLEGDTTPRAVKYCSRCDAYICEECRTSTSKRARAAFKRLTDRAVQRLMAGMGV